MKKKYIKLFLSLFIFCLIIFGYNIYTYSGFISKNLLTGTGNVNFSYKEEINIRGLKGDSISKQEKIIFKNESGNIKFDDTNTNSGNILEGEIDKSGMSTKTETGYLSNQELVNKIKELSKIELSFGNGNKIEIDLSTITALQYESIINNIEDDYIENDIKKINENIEEKLKKLDIIYEENLNYFNNDIELLTYFNNIKNTIDNIKKINTKKLNNIINFNYFFYKFLGFGEKKYSGNIINNINNIFSYSTLSFGELSNNLIKSNENKNIEKKLKNNNLTKQNSIVKKLNSSLENKKNKIDNTVIEEKIKSEPGLTVEQIKQIKINHIKKEIQSYCNSLYKGDKPNIHSAYIYTGEPVDWLKNNENKYLTISVIDKKICKTKGRNPCYSYNTILAGYTMGNRWTYNNLKIGGIFKSPIAGLNVKMISQKSCQKTVDSGSFKGKTYTWTLPNTEIWVE